MILPRQINLAELAYFMHQEAEELEAQQRIVKARALDANEFDANLATQTAKYLINSNAADIEGINLMRIVLTTVLRRLKLQNVQAHGSNETAVSELTSWLENMWNENAMDIKAADLHRFAERDGEAFALVDYDTAAGVPRIHVHQRYTSPEISYGDTRGDGDGCKAHYRNGDRNQQLEMVSQRWTETIWNNGQPETRQRMTLYIANQDDLPARIERYYWNSTWLPYRNGGDDWPIWWTETGTENGRSLPLPAVHFRNEEMQPATKQVWGLQNGVDHAWSSLLGSITQTGFRTLFSLGFYPTTDGKPPAADRSNVLELAPGMMYGAAGKQPGQASVTVIDPASPQPVLESINAIAIYCAFVAGLPVQNFIASKAIASATTLQQGESELLAHVDMLQTLFGHSWVKVLTVARQLENLFGSAQLDETAVIAIEWAPSNVVDTGARNEQAVSMKTTGVPDEEIWRSVWGFDETQVEQMKQIIRSTTAPGGINDQST